MNIDYKLIGQRIKEARQTKGFTQEQLAEKLDVSIGYVSQLERGVTKISLDTLAAVSTTLSTDITFFLSGSAIGGKNYMQNEFFDRFSKLAENDKRNILGFIDVILKNY